MADKFVASVQWSGRAWGIFSLVLAVTVAAAFSAAWAQENIIETSHRGVSLIGVPPDPTVNYDVTIIDPRQAIEAIIEGLDLLLEISSRSAGALETLKKAGDVVIIYHPAFPFKAASSLGTELAAFFPYFFTEQSNSGEQKDFPVVIGRYIIKWGKVEIALTIAHELLGHGIQHLFSGMPFAEAERNMRLFASAVMPELKKLDVAPPDFALSA